MYIRFLVVVIVSSLFISCDSDCESIKIGDKYLSPEAKAYLTYTVGQKLTFISEDGESKEFTVSQQPGTTQLCVKVICQPFDPYKQRGCEYYEGESYYYTLVEELDTIYLHLKVGIEPYEDAKELFYEYAQIGLTGQSDGYFAASIPKVYFTDPVFDVEQTSFDSLLVSENLYNAGDTTFNSVEVKEFYHQTVKDSLLAALVFNKSSGFVAFKHKQKWWYLR